MGKHSLFFVNQVHGANLDCELLSRNDALVGTDGCYQGNPDGPNCYSISGKRWGLDRWTDPPFTPRVPITPDYLEEGNEELQLTERDVRRMVSG